MPAPRCHGANPDCSRLRSSLTSALKVTAARRIFRVCKGGFEQNAFPNPATGDLERGAEQLGGRLQDEQARREQSHALDVEAEATGQVGSAGGGEESERPAERLGV